MEHTPGPWTLIDGAIIAKELNDCGNWIVVELPERNHTPSEQDKANAYLIAAAPDLLDACKTALAFIYSLPSGPSITPSTQNAVNAVHKARAAIAKAEGGERNGL